MTQFSFPPAIPYRQNLDNGFALRTPASSEDVERVADFQASVHGPEVGPMMRNLLTRHPAMQMEDQVFVEDDRGNVISGLCLIPWTWRYAGIDLPVGEMGVVATAEAYRGRGLVRTQVDYFKRRLQARGCLLSAIQGIPFYYRQFGYEYALPLEGGWRIGLDLIPTPDPARYRCRPATQQDTPALAQFYQEAAGQLTVHAVRDEAVWDYLLEPFATANATSHQTWIVENDEGQAAGYFRTPLFHFGKEMVVDEVSRLELEPAQIILHQLKLLALQDQNPAIRLNLPAACDLVRLAHALGARDLGVYAWQIYIPDVPALLRALAPALERRLAGTLFARFNDRFVLSFYRQAITLHFAYGHLVEVSDYAPAPRQAHVSLPPAAFTPLILGHRSVEELRAAYPDVNIHGIWRLLMETLFPKTSSFIYTSY